MPYKNTSHPNICWVWKVVNIMWSKLCLDGVCVELLNHFDKPELIKVVISGWVSIYFNQHSNSTIRLFLCKVAAVDWHCRTWIVSSLGRWQSGQLEFNLFFLCTMVAPVAVSLLIHLGINILVDSRAYFLAMVRNRLWMLLIRNVCGIWSRIDSLVTNYVSRMK